MHNWLELWVGLLTYWKGQAYPGLPLGTPLLHEFHPQKIHPSCILHKEVTTVPEFHPLSCRMNWLCSSLTQLSSTKTTLWIYWQSSTHDKWAINTGPGDSRTEDHAEYRRCEHTEQVLLYFKHGVELWQHSRKSILKVVEFAYDTWYIMQLPW